MQPIKKSCTLARKYANLSRTHATYQEIMQPHGIRVRTPIHDEGAWIDLNLFLEIDPSLLSRQYSRFCDFVY